MTPQDELWKYGQQPEPSQASWQAAQQGQVSHPAMSGQIPMAQSAQNARMDAMAQQQTTMPRSEAQSQQFDAQKQALASSASHQVISQTSASQLSAAQQAASQQYQAGQQMPSTAQRYAQAQVAQAQVAQAQGAADAQRRMYDQNSQAVQDQRAEATTSTPSAAPPPPYSVGSRQESTQEPSGPTPPPPPQGVPTGAAAYQVAPVQQKKSFGWIVAIVAIVCLFAFMAFAVKSCNDSMARFSSFGAPSGSSLQNLDKDAVAILELDGVIQYDGTACSPEGFKELLDEAQDDPHVKALVLRVNSGGGTATAGEEMAEYLKQFEKPVVVSSASINASAAYEISAQADYIFVAKSTEIGSIGTAIQLTDLSGLFEKLGIRMDTITSADSKDSSYGYRSLTDDEREYYQRMIDQINDMFIQNVAEGRHMKEADVRKLATGLAFTGVDAIGNGLADAIGTREDAVKKAAELAGITDYTTTDLLFETYDLGSLSYLLGEDRSSVDDLLTLLEREQKENMSAR